MEELLRGTLVGLALAAPVGPVGVLCLRLALTQGRWPAAAAGLGAATADAIFGAIGGLGLVLIQTFIADHQTGLSLAGALIVIALGIATLRKPVLLEDRPSSLANLAQDFATTFSLAITNPATMIAALGVFAALGPINSNTEPYGALSLVGGVFLGSALWWLFLASVAIALRRRMLNNLGWINKISGGLLIVFGLALVAGLAANGH
jgi:threonine/homoserine/homoserine lactone efflux protein